MSPVWISLYKLLTLAGAVIFLITTRTWIKTSLRQFAILFIIAFLRDVFYAVFPFDAVSFAGDLLIVFCYFLWMWSFTGRQRIDLLAILLGVAGILGSSLVSYLKYLLSPLLPPFNVMFYNSVWILPAIVILVVRMRAVSPFNTREPDLILELRRIIMLTLGFVWLTTLAFGYESQYTHMILYPVSYLLHAMIVFRMARADVGRRDTAIESLTSDQTNLFGFMQQLSSAVSEKIEIERILSIVVQSAIRDTASDGGAILILDDSKSALRFRAIEGTYSPPFSVPERVRLRADHFAEYLYSMSLEIGTTLLGETFKKADPLFIRNVAQDGRLTTEYKNDHSLPSSIIVIPLVVAHRILGVISVTKQSYGQYFSDEDFTHLKGFADYASLSIDMHLTYLEVLEKRQIEHELSIAAEIQDKLISHKVPSMKAAEIAVLSVPAHGVNGDYFDLLPLGDQKLAFVVGDVAGKGIPAALVMVMIHSILHLIASPRRDLAQMLGWVNRGLIGQVEIDHYATLSIVSFDEASRTIEYSNAAHHPLLVFKAGTGEVELVDTKGLPVGIDPSSAYEMKTVPFVCGDIALVYTDGIVEALNPAGEQYSLDRLSSVIRTRREEPAEAIKEAIREDLATFVQSAKQHDDQTLIVLKAV